MKTAANKVVTEALNLPRADRAFLAEKLLESLDDEPFEVSPAWRKEIRRRCDEIDSGRVKLIPAKKVFKDLASKLG